MATKRPFLSLIQPLLAPQPNSRDLVLYEALRKMTRNPEVLEAIEILRQPAASTAEIMLHEALKRVSDALFVEGQSPFPETDQSQSYVTAAAETSLENSRRLIAGTGIALVDGGPGGTLEINDAPDPILEFFEFDDFVSGETVSPGTGKLNWNSSGTTKTFIAAEVGHPGIIRLTTNTTSGNGVGLFTPAVAAGFDGFFNSDEDFDFSWLFRVDDITDVIIRAGAWGTGYTNNTTPNVPGFYFEQLNTDSTVFAVSQTSAASRTRADMGVQLVVDTWYRARIRRINSTTVGFAINDGAEVTMTATQPSNAGLNPIINPSITANEGMSLDVDLFVINIAGPLVRYVAA